MLNLEEIAKRIHDPSLCSVEESDDLRSLIDKFPYAQIFPILYLKALANNNDVRFDDDLTKYAYRISDRTELYRLIHGKSTAAPMETSSSFIESPSAELQDSEAVIEPEKEVETTIVSIIPSDDLSENHNIEEISNEENDVAAGEQIKTIAEQHIIQNDPLRPDPIDETEDEESEDVFIPLNITTIDGIAITEHIEESEPSEIEEELIESDSEGSPSNELEQFEKEIISETISSHYNLDHLVDHDKLPQVNTEDLDEQDQVFTPTVHEEENGAKSFSSWLRSNVNDKKPLIDEEKARIDAILDQFIKDEPKITRPSKDDQQEERQKKEFFSPVKKAKESLDMNSMPVSETLARIFALQGNYPKAIFAYEQLILINPEKKVFFASQIEELKKKLNT